MSDQRIILGLATIVVLGIGAQWVAKRRDFPSLLLLLPAGLFAGNVGNLVDPEALFGDTLFPGVTMLVGLLLFQSGLELRFTDLSGGARRPVIRLNTVAALLTLVGASAAVWFVFRPGGQLAILAGAILVVSGPTVVSPLLDIVRPAEPVGSILRWEGTMLDPIGATMGVIALNFIVASDNHGVPLILQMGIRLGLGVLVGLVAGGLLVLVLARFLVTDQMEAAVALLFAVAAFSVAEMVLSEAGLFATVTMGLVIANQRTVPVARISGFGETLEVFIIGSLFIVLGALIDIGDVLARGWRILLLVAILVIVVRPLSVALSLWRTSVSREGRALIAWMDPRGVVAAATAAAFSGTLANKGIEADFLSPVVFGVILGTGIIYGLTAAPVATMLGVRKAPPNGLLLVGSEQWMADLAACLTEMDVPVATIGVPAAVSASSDSGGLALPWGYKRIGDAELRKRLSSESVGKALVAAEQDPQADLFIADLVEVLGRRRVYRVKPSDEDTTEHALLVAATAQAFRSDVTTTTIRDAIDHGALISEIDPDNPADALILAIVDPDGTVHIGVGRTDPAGAATGARMVGLVPSSD